MIRARPACALSFVARAPTQRGTIERDRVPARQRPFKIASFCSFESHATPSHTASCVWRAACALCRFVLRRPERRVEPLPMETTGALCPPAVKHLRFLLPGPRAASTCASSWPRAPRRSHAVREVENADGGVMQFMSHWTDRLNAAVIQGDAPCSTASTPSPTPQALSPPPWRAPSAPPPSTCESRRASHRAVSPPSLARSGGASPGSVSCL